MKKIVFGVGLLLSGIIGIVGVIMAVIIPGTGAYGSDWLRMMANAGLVVPFIIFLGLAVLGLITAISGVLEKN